MKLLAPPRSSDEKDREHTGADTLVAQMRAMIHTLRNVKRTRPFCESIRKKRSDNTSDHNSSES